MIIEKISAISGLSTTYIDEQKKCSERLFKIKITNETTSYETYALYYGNYDEILTAALIYEKIDGIMTPFVIKKSPESHSHNFSYNSSLQMAALRIESLLEEENLSVIKYRDMGDELVVNFVERIFN